MTVAVLRYNAGNTKSVVNALARLDQPAVVSDDPRVLREAEKVIVPGVGAAGPALEYLRERHLDQVLTSLSQPVLGICLGMQIFCHSSAEGETPCLNIFPERVELFRTSERVPHMGWNAISSLEGPLFHDIADGAYVYFVHSYRVPLAPSTTAQCEYGCAFSAALQQQNIYAVQFHPEKSGETGAQILRNFLAL
ncbi:imidazole glycerol phosphate synthase subunit HisH [bacterium]|nr:imidazole glycerol phosphate synthase subunit HisH [bacterium]